MIAKGKSISHLGVALNYVLNKPKSYILDKNIVGNKGRAIVQEFKRFQQLNARCERNSLAFVLSPTVADGKRLGKEGFKQLNAAFLKTMGLAAHQYIAIVHRDKAHQHVHLFVNRVDYEGSTYSDRFVSNRASRAGAEIAQAMGLQTAQAVQMQKHRDRGLAQEQCALL